MDIYAEVTGKITAKLREGTVPWHKPWSAAPSNYISRRPYRGVNVWLLDGDYESPYWLTYRQAMSIDGHVRRGEHGTRIIYWNWKEAVDEDTDEVKRYPILRCYTVFNVSQCDGIDVEVNNVEPIASAEEIVCGYMDAPSLKVGGDRAAYSPSTDTVYMPAMGTFESSSGYYSTLYHEYVHSTGHSSRLDRSMNRDAYSEEELIAEMGAAYLCAISDTELTATLDNSAAYMDYWLGRISEDKRLIVQISSKAQRAADWILGVRSAPSRVHDEAGE